MKTLLQITLLSVCLIGCKSASVDKEDVIRYQETILINEVPRTTLTFFDVNDSRCPANAQCIWAGNATVDLALTGVSTEGIVTKHISMCLGSCKTSFGADTLDHEFTGQKYRFILTAVNPYPQPETQQSKSGYTISLQVEKRF
jgi:hypothetical protein